MYSECSIFSSRGKNDVHMYVMQLSRNVISKPLSVCTFVHVYLHVQYLPRFYLSVYRCCCYIVQLC